ncbi:MAG TPA: DUF1634 domain-containing protein [Dehalococcoidia bacterium]|jgi:uncharacterized membrane protein
MKRKKIDESRLKVWVSLTYRIGIAMALTLILAGFVLLIYISGFNNIQPLVRLEQIPAAIVISIGILLLLVIPVIQVVLSTIYFSLNKNSLYIGISLAVLCLAGISIIVLLI